MSDEQSTPQFDDADLLAYLNGDLAETLARQIDQSDEAQRRLALLARQERQLVAGLYRASCPDVHTLGEYHMQMLATERAAQIAGHLTICPHCSLELDELRAAMRELAPDLETSFVERLRVLVARLVPDLPTLGAGSAPMPALAGMRGAMDGPRLYEAGAVHVSLEVQDAPAPGRKTVLGLVTGAEAEGWQATLWQEDGPLAELVQTLQVDELGNFIFDDLAPGEYALTLRGEDVEIVVQDLSVS